MAQTILKPGIQDKIPNIMLPKAEVTPKELYCRLCLFTLGSHNFKQLFSPFNNTESIVEVIEGIARVKILERDEHSKLICQCCFEKLTATKNFKSLIESSDSRLNSQLLNSSDNDPDCCIIIKQDAPEIIEIDDTEPAQTVDEQCTNEEPVVEDENSKVKRIIELLKYEHCYSKSCSGGTENESVKRNDGAVDRMDVGTQMTIKEEPAFDSELLSVEKEILVDDNIDFKVEIDNVKSEEESYEPLRRGLRRRKYKKNTIIRKKRLKRRCLLHCPDCTKTFTNEKDRKLHMSVHTTKQYTYYCSICNKGFISKSGFNGHELAHKENRINRRHTNDSRRLRSSPKDETEQKLYNCGKCDKAFKTRYQFSAHLISHTTEDTQNDYQIVNKPFETVDKQAIPMVNVTTNKDPTTKDDCKTSGLLVTDSQEHFKFRLTLFKCSNCEKLFPQKTMFDNHICDQEQDRIFECDICQMILTTPHSYMMHKRLHVKYATEDMCQQKNDLETITIIVS